MPEGIRQGPPAGELTGDNAQHLSVAENPQGRHDCGLIGALRDQRLQLLPPRCAMVLRGAKQLPRRHLLQGPFGMTDKLVPEKFAGGQQAVKVTATALGLQMLLQQGHGLGVECFCQQPPTAFQRGAQGLRHRPGISHR